MTTGCSRLVLLLVCLAAGLPADAAQRGAMDADAKELSYYRLTLPNLQKVIAVNRALVQTIMQDPKVREGLKIDAELEALSKKDELSEADEKRMAELEARKEQLEDAMDNPLGGDARTLGEMEARIRNYPPMAQALQREGMTPREYAKFWLAFLQAGFAHGFQKSGMLKELPADVNPENVKFIDQHQAEIAAMQKEFEALGRRK
jgi:hypothetical protein